MKLQELLCDQLENLSEDSDEERDTKFNIFDQTDLIEEEDEGAEYDEEIDEDCGIEMVKDSSQSSGELNKLPDIGKYKCQRVN